MLDNMAIAGNILIKEFLTTEIKNKVKVSK